MQLCTTARSGGLNDRADGLLGICLFGPALPTWNKPEGTKFNYIDLVKTSAVRGSWHTPSMSGSVSGLSIYIDK